MESVRILKDIMLHGVLLSWDNKRESLLCNYWVVQKVCGKNHTKKWRKLGNRKEYMFTVERKAQRCGKKHRKKWRKLGAWKKNRRVVERRTQRSGVKR